MKKLLIVIDMQNDFIDGALGTAEAEAIVPAVKAKIESYPPEAVIATMDTHGPDYLSTQEGRNLPVVHCVRETEGWQLHDAVAEVMPESAILVEKPTFGAIRLPELLAPWVETLGQENVEVEVIGLCTDICVVSNALLLKAAYPEMPISLDQRCCAGVTPASHEAALTTMRMCQIKVY